MESLLDILVGYIYDKNVKETFHLVRRKKLKNVKIVDTVERERERELQFTQRGYRNQYQKRTIQKNKIE